MCLTGFDFEWWTSLHCLWKLLLHFVPLSHSEWACFDTNKHNMHCLPQNHHIRLANTRIPESRLNCKRQSSGRLWSEVCVLLDIAGVAGLFGGVVEKTVKGHCHWLGVITPPYETFPWTDMMFLWNDQNTKTRQNEMQFLFCKQMLFSRQAQENICFVLFCTITHIDTGWSNPSKWQIKVSLKK